MIVLLAVANGVFAGTEIAVVALRQTRVQELVEKGNRRARAAKALRENPEQFLATVQVGITVVSATAAAFGGASLAARFAPFLAEHGFGPYADEVALGLVVGLVSYLSIVIGELVPKSLALRSAEKYALLVARPILGLSRLAKPIVWFLTQSSNLVLRPFGDRTDFSETRHSAEELQKLVGEAAEAGTVHPEAGEIASRALDFGELVAEDVMVPRQDVVMLSWNAASEEIKALLTEHPHTRMPVYRDSIDNVIGYVNVKDVLKTALNNGPIDLDQVVRPAYFVPEFKPAVELLTEMRKRRAPLAIVVEEQGGTAGIVTFEDLVEELVGEIFSEHEGRASEPLHAQPDGSYIVRGSMPVRDLNRELGLKLPDHGAFSTVAGLCLQLGQRIPRSGERFEFKGGVTLEVLEASPRRIGSLRVTLGKPATDGDEEASSD